MIDIDAGAQPARRFEPARIAIILAAIIVAIAVARVVVIHKLSEAFFAQPDLPVAYGVNPKDGMVGGYLAWALQRSGKPDLAEPLARKAFATTPLSASALGTIAIANVARDPLLANRLFASATGMGWRDLTVQTWAARAALRAGDYARAANHIDAAARIQGANNDVRTLIDAMADNPAALPALTARLAQNPLWRPEYFESAILPLGDIEAREHAVSALNGTATDLESTIVMMLSARIYGLSHAYNFWRAAMRPNVAGFVDDPDFAQVTGDPENGNPFIWHLAAAPGFTTDTDPARPALHVTTDGSTSGPVAMQLVRISPGTHQLSAAARFSTADGGSAFRWGVTCWDDHKVTRELTPLSGVATGTAGFSFAIPTDGTCPIQSISLRAQPANAPGQIEAWFNRVQIK